MTKRPLSILCDETTAHCVFCRGPQGAAFADAMAETFDFAREADGRPACKHNRWLGWAPPPPPSKSGRRRSPAGKRPRRVKLNVVVPRDVADARLAKCKACAHGQTATCLELKRQRPNLPAVIARGVNLPYARCPLDPPEWEIWSGVGAATPEA